MLVSGIVQNGRIERVARGLYSEGCEKVLFGFYVPVCVQTFISGVPKKTMDMVWTTIITRSRES